MGDKLQLLKNKSEERAVVCDIKHTNFAGEKKNTPPKTPNILLP